MYVYMYVCIVHSVFSSSNFYATINIEYIGMYIHTIFVCI